MTKQRAPLSVEDALVRIAAQVGSFDTMASHVDRSVRTVRNWSDPDTPEDIPVSAAIRLDLLHVEHGGSGTPIADAYALQLDLAAMSKFSAGSELLAKVADTVREGGEAHAALVRACQPDATAKDREHALRESQEAYDALKPVIAALEGARPQPPP